MSALVSWGRRRKSFPCFWARIYGSASTRAIPESGPFCRSSVEPTGAVLCPQDQEKTHVFSNGNHGKSRWRNGRTSVGAWQGSTRASPQSREGVKLGEPGRGTG